ncbi:hypothetical protein D6D15_00307 [Aureobasidium pullulans]|uniref:Uncharacterized protein n=1 Tax=Aureobasidium pullulans TaxID=5580 RepID=A0A4S9BWK9_AURPU|nr:hypothetical protein D6D15_00307 [Aureobasidium pullulans]
MPGIALVARKEALTITLSVEGCTDFKNIVHFYRVRVTKFSTRGGRSYWKRGLHEGMTWIAESYVKVSKKTTVLFKSRS